MTNKSIGSLSGYCAKTQIYHSLKPEITIPPLTAKISVAEYLLNLLKSPVNSSSPENVFSSGMAVTANTDACNGRGRTTTPENTNFCWPRNTVSVNIDACTTSETTVLTGNTILPKNISATIGACSDMGRATLSGNGTAIIDVGTGVRVSYADFISQVETLAVSLRMVVGLKKGDVAFILAPSSVEITVLYFSLLLIGVVISPANPVSSKSDISHQVSLSKPVIAFATLKTAANMTSLKYKTILLDSDEFRTMKRRNVGKRLELDRVEVFQSNAAAILYSSGTTGNFKGVVLSHRNLTSAMVGIHADRKKRKTPAVVLCTVPYFHIYGLIYCLKSVGLGETAVIMERFDLKVMLKAIEEYRITHVAVAPPVLVAVMKNEEVLGEYDLKSLEFVASGGAPLGKEVALKFKARFPSVFLAQAYGLTETTGGLSRTTSPEDYRIGSNGRLSSNCQARIVDPDTGVALPPCKKGELLFKGPIVMKGYISAQESAVGSFDSDGWFKTGDLCYIDDEGFLFVVDRLKELIKYKGYQVAPAELEELLQSHPDIIDAAVIPYPNEEAGQVPMAFVVKKSQSSLSEEQVMEFIAKQVAPYKKIRRVSFINSIPKNAPGKVLRKELMKLALLGHTSKL